MALEDSDLTFDERTKLDFVLALRQRWADTVYPALRAEYIEADGPVQAETLDQATETVHNLPLYPWFSWMERAQQKMLWRTAGDAVMGRSAELRELLRSRPENTLGELVIDDDFELPQWYTDVDIHVQPGGVWSDDLSAFVYELGAKIVMLRDNDGYRFHRLFVETALEPGARRIVDIGCGFGKSTMPLVDQFPDADVVGLDLSAPVVRLAHRQAEQAGKKVTFMQRDGSATGLESSTFDLVTGTMLLHELPAQIIKKTINEAARLLKPGGTLRFLEFSPTGDLFRDVTVYEHAERNNEPFFRDLFASNFEEIGTEAGLVNIRWVPFDEREKGIVPEGYEPRNEWHFPWAVLMAEKPS